jgi:uncharacterized protein YkwD
MSAAALCCAGVTGAADPGDVFTNSGAPSSTQGPAGTGGGWTSPWGQDPADPWPEAEAEVVRLVNDKRPGYGCEKLGTDEVLTQAAREHSQGMAGDGERSGGWFFGGSSARDRAHDLGYAHPSGEIVASGFETAEEAVRSWTKRGVHNQVLADCAAEDIGVGVVKGEDGHHWTVILGHGS